MSLKSIIQILILILIISIIGAVYYQYFDTKNNLVDETNLLNNENEILIKSLERKLFDLELKNKKLNDKIKVIADCCVNKFKLCIFPFLNYRTGS